MNPFRTIDRFLLDRVYQPLIDWSQRQPGWWAEQAAWASAALYSVRILAGNSAMPWFWMLFTLGGLVLLLIVARHPPALASFGSAPWIRCMWGVFLLNDIFVLYALPFTPHRPLSFAITIAGASFYYFAACRPPRPPVRRRQIVTARGAA